MKVLIDTTVLCAAIRKPDGLCMRLLLPARYGFFGPVVTEEIVAEWVRNCRRGLGRGRGMTVFAEKDLDAFVDLLEPLMSAEVIARVRIGRAAGPAYPVRQEGGFTLIQVPRDAKEPRTHMIDEATVGIRDIGDVHVVEAALQQGCQFLCTANSRDFVDGLSIGGLVEVIKPKRLFDVLVAR